MRLGIGEKGYLFPVPLQAGIWAAGVRIVRAGSDIGDVCWRENKIGQR
ncbi:MAG: hypothetical protein ACXW16_03860 [Burkholderiaceae bacterium]